MSAVEVAVDETVPLTAWGRSEWQRIGARRPLLAATGLAYLAQIDVSLRPRSVSAADNALRVFIEFLDDEHPDVKGFAEVGRTHIEDFKRWLVRRRTAKGTPLTANTVRQRLGTMRTFFDRIIEWDWNDAPLRTPIFAVDLPIVDDPLPKFLDDASAARLLRAARGSTLLDRVVIELLAHTGIRVGELCDLERDAVFEIGKAWWLRVPVGKLHNDRFVPLLPSLVELLSEWVSTNADGGSGRLVTKDGKPLSRYQVTRILDRIAKHAGVGHVHPHQLRHTLATQAVNRGMRLEAVAALLGHRSLRMTAVYARIANTTVAAEYQAASEKVDALYRDLDLGESPAMRQLRQEHRRMLANGWCTRPKETDCAFEAICEGCGFFSTTIEFKPTLQAHPPSPTRSRRRQRPGRPRRALHEAPRRHRGTRMNMIGGAPTGPADHRHNTRTLDAMKERGLRSP